MSDPPRQTRRPTGRLAAVWFADIVGFSPLAAEDHSRALGLIELFQDAVRRQIDEHDGRLVKFIGDGALAEFSSTSAAVRAANALQDDFNEQSAASGHPARLRIGIHSGEVAATPDGDIYGDGVNTASRLEGEAAPGRVIVSEDVWRSLRSRPEFRFAPLGKRELKGIPQPISVFHTVPEAASTEDGREQPSWKHPFELFGQFRERRLFRIIVAYAAAGWIVLQLADQLVSRDLLPELAYRLTLIWYLGGFVAAALLGWYHGDQGRQSTSPLEIVLLSGLALGLLSVSASTISDDVAGGPTATAVVENALDPRRVAVLYFDDRSQDGDYQYLAAGLTESLIDELADVDALDIVISPSGVAQFQQSELPRDSIARLLEAGTIVDGSIERAGDSIRVNVRLVDGAKGTTFKAAAFALPGGRLLDLREHLVQNVARFLREWLGEKIELREERLATESADAWELLQRAKQARKQAKARLHADDRAGWDAALQRADTLLARAEALDPTWAKPVTMRGWIGYRRSRMAHDPHQAVTWIQRGLEHAARALAQDSTHARALELRGTLRYWHWLLNVTPDPEEHTELLRTARADLERAVRLDPTLASAYSTLSHLYYQHDIAAAVLAARRAYEEDAYLDLADAILWRLFTGSYDLAQFTQAQRWCREGVKRFPHDYRFAVCRLSLMTTPRVEPDVERAWTLLAAIDSLAPQPRRVLHVTQSRLLVGGVIARAGLPDSADAVLTRAHEVAENEIAAPLAHELFYVEAAMRVIAGDEAEAIDLLERYAAANPHASFEHHWWWRNLQDNPGFARLPSGH